jgi:DNA (cytosine-5)-methyltransferase 1
MVLGAQTKTYFELFAGTGIGGMPFDALGYTCLGYSEYNKYAAKNYDANFPGRTNYGDITLIDEKTLPDFDVLIGGSPCTDISKANMNITGLAGNESKLFYDYIRILDHKLPKYFVFENVKNLLYCNKGADLKIVLNELQKNYNITYKLLNTADYGIPQRRPRVYIIGQRKDLGDFNFSFPISFQLDSKVQDLLDEVVDDKYYLSPAAYAYVTCTHVKYGRSIKWNLPVAVTLLASMHKNKRAGICNYYDMPTAPIGKTNLRRPTPRECARLQGLPDTYKIVVSDTQAYMLMGNAMSLNVITLLAKEIDKVWK